MKNLSKVLALVLVIAMVFSMAVSASAATSFKDDATINYDEAVQLLSALDVLNGYDTDGDGKGDTFKPGAKITRAELAVMVSYMVANEWSEFGLYSDIAKLNADYKALCTFADSKAHWAAGFIAYCAGNGYISGRDANTFDPDATVTVAEASVILLRVMGYDAAKEEYGTTAGTVKGYNLQLDARNAGLLNGLDVDFFAPATREEVAQLFLNALDGYVVTYNSLYDFSLVFNPQLVITGNTAYQTTDKLVEFCFTNVEKVAATTAYGYAGHQWVAYYKLPTTTTVALTDVFVDDTVMNQFKGGTPMATVAAAMGLNTKSSPVYVKFYTNGAEVAGAGYYTYNQLANGVIADNATLVIVRDYDRSVGGTYYKLMTYTEYIAKVTRSAGTITDRTSAHFGEYYFTFTYFDNYQDAAPVGANYVYSANKDAYDVNALYLVVPNANANNFGVPNYSTITDKEFFLSIKPAQVSDAVKVTGAQTNVPAASSYVFVGTTKYNMSKVYNDFTKAGFAFNKAVHFVYNSAGYVIATVDPAAVPGTVLETGYVYLDKFEYAVTVTGTSTLIGQAAYTWSAQAKAQVYFPSVTGTSVPTVIDIATAKSSDAYGTVTGGVAYIANVNAQLNAGSYNVNGDGFVALSNVSTSSYWDLTNNEYTYGNTVVNGNVRVFDVTFDGWYKYEKQTNGTYALIPVDQDSMTTYGNLKVETAVIDDGAAKNALYLTSGTVLNAYKMDLATMTASVASVTGYATIPAGTYGGTQTAGYPAMGVVGGEISINARYTDRIDSFSQFATVNPTGSYNNAFYAGRGDYNTYLAKWEHFFYINGQKVVLFAASEVAVTDRFDDPTAATVNVKAADLELIKTAIYDLVLDAAGNLKVATRETVVSSGITAFTYVDGANYLHFAPTAATQVVGGLVADANGLIKVEFNTAKVYNMANGSVTTIGAGDTVYYVLDNGKVAELWVTKALGGGIADPMKP